MTMGEPKKHNRRLGLCGVALTRARTNRHEFGVMSEIQDELERIMVESGYLNGAPFEWVTISIRFGLKNEDAPHFERINKKYGDLPLAIEVDTHEMRTASREILKKRLTVAVLKALIGAGMKYELPTTPLEGRLKELMGGTDE